MLIRVCPFVFGWCWRTWRWRGVGLGFVPCRGIVSERDPFWNMRWKGQERGWGWGMYGECVILYGRCFGGVEVLSRFSKPREEVYEPCRRIYCRFRGTEGKLWLQSMREAVRTMTCTAVKDGCLSEVELIFVLLSRTFVWFRTLLCCDRDMSPPLMHGKGNVS